MKVKELIKVLKGLVNQDAEIRLLGNVGHPDDDETDVRFDFFEVWDYGDESITLFFGLSDETLEQISEQQKDI